MTDDRDDDSTLLPGLPSLRRLLPRQVGLPRLPGSRAVPHDPREEVRPPRDIGEVIVDCALYVDGARTATVPMAEAMDRAREADGFVWIGLKEPTGAEFAEVAARFDLPPLAVEDAIRAHQRPKLERYGDITFVVIKPVRYVDHVEMVDVSEVAIFIGPEFVITVRHGTSDVPARVREELEADPELLRVGPGAVLYRMADLVVDDYGDVIDDINVDIDEIESQVFGGDQTDHAQRIYTLKREVLEFRRAVLPFGAAVKELAEHETPGIADDLAIYFRDVHDHVLRAADAIETYDRLLTDVLQADLAQVSVRQNKTAVRQNEDTRKISAWAAIALVPTAIAGIYGMNFENMPELRTEYGYYVVVGAIVGICGLLYRQFRKNGWL